MAINQHLNKKLNGIYYTPPELASFLVKPLVGTENTSILDPAYGEGALLLAAENFYQNNVDIQSGQLILCGCDIHPVNGLLKHLPSSDLVEMDFFDYPLDHKYDTILMNPPYVRHHNIDKNKIKAYQIIFPELCQLSSTSDLWTYFLTKSVSHLKKGGNIGAILPWSFLQADYSQRLRTWLANNFGEIKVLALRSQYFDNAKERVVLVWLNDYGQTNHSIKIASSKQIQENIVYINIDNNKWTADKVIFSEIEDSESILSRYVDDFSFSAFKNYAEVKIGIVTGADSYFIISDNMVRDIGASDDHLIPIFTTSKNFRGLYSSGGGKPKRLLSLTSENFEKYKEYIDKGKKEEWHLRSHSLRRNPWYAVSIGKTPDAFFPYRMSQIPCLVINDKNAQCTNSVHRIYFRKLSEIEIKWIQISLISVPGQLSLEIESKTYGRGMLKIEPKSLKNSIVYKSNDNSIDRVYASVNELLQNGNKLAAMELSTNFINKRLKIPSGLANAALSTLLEFQTRRLDR